MCVASWEPLCFSRPVIGFSRLVQLPFFAAFIQVNLDLRESRLGSAVPLEDCQIAALEEWLVSRELPPACLCHRRQLLP